MRREGLLDSPGQPVAIVRQSRIVPFPLDGKSSVSTFALDVAFSTFALDLEFPSDVTLPPNAASLRMSQLSRHIVPFEQAISSLTRPNRIVMIPTTIESAEFPFREAGDPSLG